MREPTYYDWIELVEGILLTMCGLITFVLPVYLPGKLIFLYGIIAAIIGIANIVLYAKSGHEIGTSRIITLIGGSLSVLVGLFLAVHTSMNLSSFAVLYSLWLIAYCLTEAGLLSQERDTREKNLFRAAFWISIAGAVIGMGLIIISRGSLNTFKTVLAAVLTVLGIDRCVLFCSQMTRPLE